MSICGIQSIETKLRKLGMTFVQNSKHEAIEHLKGVPDIMYICTNTVDSMSVSIKKAWVCELTHITADGTP